MYTRDSSIDSLDGIGDFDWTSTPTTELELHGNQISSIEAGAFSGLTNLRDLSMLQNWALTELNLAEADFSSLEYFEAIEDATTFAIIGE